MKKSEIGLIPVSMGLFSMMMLLVIPGSTALGNDTFVAYGVATITQFDTDKNPVFTQSIHNRILDSGEDFMLNQAFAGLGTDVANADQIGAICISSATTNTVETHSLSDFNTAKVTSGTDLNNCLSLDATSTGQVVTIGPVEFTTGTASPAHWNTADTIESVGICSAQATGTHDCTDVLFATADVGTTTFNNDGETVQVTYTFDLSSSSN